MSDQIGSAYVSIDADTSLAEAAFRKLQADADRAMAAIGRKRAEAEVTAKTTDFDRKIDNAERRLHELEKERAEVEIKGDTSDWDEAYAKTKAELKDLKRERATIRVDAKELRDANRTMDLAAKKAGQMSKAYQDNERASRKLTAARKAESLATVKSAADVDRLRVSYSKMAGEIKNMERRTGRPGGIFRTDAENRKLQSLRSGLALTAHKIEELGGSVDDIDPDLERHQGTLGRWADSLSHVRLQMGFFSATLRQLGIGLVALGPVITGLGGGLASLIGVAGTGLAGGLAVGAAGLGGFALSALGVGLVIKPLISDLTAAQKASKAYNDAILKYGKGSTQAADAQEKLNHTLRGVSPAARSAFKDAGGLKTEWEGLTKAARVPVFDAIGASLKTVHALLPSFARQTVATTRTLSEGWQRWMTALRSKGAKEALNDIMSNFRASLPGLMNGLQSLAATMGRISASASKFLPDLSHGFAAWSQSLESSVGAGDVLDAKIGRLVGHMRDIGHLAQASGGLLATFFNASANSGDDLIKTFTQTEKAWTHWMQSAEGKASLRNFFAEATDETKQFFSALGHLTSILFQLGRATAPISNGLMDIVTVIGDVVDALMSLKGVNTVIQGVGIGLAGLFVVSRVRAFAAAIKDAVVALRGLAIMQGISDLASGGGLLGGLFGRGGAAGAGRQLAMFSSEAEGAAAASAGLGASLFPPVAAAAALTAGLYVLVTAFGDSTTAAEDARTAFRDAAGNVPHAVSELTKGANEYTQAQRDQAHATDEVTTARKHLAGLQQEGASTQKLIKASRELAAAEKQQAAQQREVGKQNRETIRNSKGVLDAAESRVRSAKDEVHALQTQLENRKRMNKYEGKPESTGVKDLADEQAKAQHRLAIAQQEVAESQRALAVASIPVERAYRNLAPLTEQTQRALDRFSQTAGAGVAKKFGGFVDPKDVQRATALSNQLTKLGRGGQAKEIAVKSRGADDAIAKLNRLQRQSARVDAARATVKVGANDTQAQSKLKRLSILSQRVTGSKNTIRILANSDNAEQAIHRLRANLKDVALKKYEARIDAIDNSKGKTEAAKTRLREVAAKTYTARIEAVDNASAKLKTAARNADAVGHKNPRVNITASAGQAHEVISGVESSLNAIDGKTATTRIVTVHETRGGGGRYEGGPSAYVPFVTGGPSDRELQRAAERAVYEPAGRSRKVARPTMLTGEEAPRHPEYVIATNPAYRAGNERYLEAAASDMGYAVVPAYKTGGKKATKGGANKGTSQAAAGPGPGPKRQKAHQPFYIRHKKFDPTDVNTINRLEDFVSGRSRFFNTMRDREEEEIRAKKRTAWDFDLFRGILGEERTAFNQITQARGRVEKTVGDEIGKANKALSGPLSAKNVHRAQVSYNQASKEYSAIRQGKEESSHDYHNRKDAAKRKKEEAKRTKERLETQRENAKNIRREAKDALNEVRLNRKEQSNEEAELYNEETELNDIQANPELAPYYESPADKGKEGPTIGEQTATLSQARQELFEQFGSNIAGPAGATVGGGPAATGTKPVSSGSAYSAAAVAGSAAPTIIVKAHHAPGQAGVSSAAAVSGKGNKVEVTNNFAAPPPDPHTWTRQQEFELGALA